jgi:hypothetical protein
VACEAEGLGLVHHNGGGRFHARAGLILASVYVTLLAVGVDRQVAAHDAIL